MYVGLVCPYSLLKACTSVLVEGNAIAEEAILLNKAITETTLSLNKKW